MKHKNKPEYPTISGNFIIKADLAKVSMKLAKEIIKQLGDK